MIKYYLQLLHYLSEKRKKQIYCLLFFLLITSLLEALPIFIIGPFINSNFLKVPPENLSFIYSFFASNGVYINFLYFSILLIFSSAFKTYSIYVYSKMISIIGHDLSLKIYRKTLSQPYEKTLSKNPSRIISAITQELTRVIGKCFGFIEFISSLITIFILVLSLLIIDWKINLLFIIFTLITYILISIYSEKKLLENGKIVTRTNIEHVKLIRETIGSLRDIIIYKKFKFFEDNYKKIDIPKRNAKASNYFFLNGPKYILEPLAIIIFLGVIILVKNDFSNESIIPLLGTLLYGLQKIIFSGQKVYREFSGFISCKASFKIIIDFLNLPFYENQSSKMIIKNKLEFNSLKLENLHFNFNRNGTYNKIFKNLNLKIKKGDKVFLFGPSGSGKTTLINLILGMYSPEKGNILINNENINFKLSEWQDVISYVPQDPYFMDKTIAENIAFGEDPKDIDYEKIEKVIKLSCLHEFIKSTPEGYFTNIGDKAVEVSGGQKQRIAIARALYKKKQIIILDEPTSALDNETESLIFQIISKLNKSITIIFISHKMNNLELFNKIINLKELKKSDSKEN
tara:strand:+ start:24 stop:1739 length:1716 start_codon:yes stop_codon:yes gene_type:complete